MKEIKWLVHDINEEVEGAEHYAKLAMEYKDKHPSWSSKFAEMAKQELSHIDGLHRMAVELISEKTSQGVEAPAAMQVVWDWEHEKRIDHIARIKQILEMAR